MNPASGHKNWLTLLHRWVGGEADRKDERALEALAKEDPFLADAFEGYRSMPTENHAANVTRLKVDLRSKYQKKRRSAGFYLIRAAALGVVLVAAWLLLQQFDQKENGQTGLVQSSEELAPQAPQTIPLDGSTAADSVKNDQLAAKTQIEDASHNPPTKNLITRADGPQRTFNIETNPAPPPVTLNKPAANKRKNGFEQSVQEQELATTDDMASKVERDADTAPPAAESPTVAMKKSNDRAKPATDSFSDVAESNQAGVENPVPLDEVAVSESKEGKSKKDNAPEPKGGFEAFEKYIEKNLKYPATAAVAGIEGEVVTSFRIKEDGSLYDFRTIKPLGYNCDEEAIRLLREGPKWNAPAGAYATYPIFFKKK